jgi:hypothetical protein
VPPGYRIVVFLTAMLMAYTLITGVRLLMGSAPPENAYFLIGLACVIPAGAYAYGFVTTSQNRDFGLLLSAVGWAFASLALFIQHGAVQNSYAQAAPGDLVAPVEMAGGSLFFTILSLMFILAGAVLSIQIWSRTATMNDRS